MRTKSTPGPRRVRVERGVYYRDARAGRRYEVMYRDSDGRTRWQVVPGGLKEARQARADVLSRVGRGERVAPTRLTVADYAETWLEAQRLRLRPKTLKTYEASLRVHVLPAVGRLKLSALAEDDVMRLIATMQAGGSAPWTIRGTLTPLSRLLSHAVRRGLIPSNPVQRLERGERPAVERREMRVLDTDEIGRLLNAAAEPYRALIATAIFTGARQGELLGLRWQDLDLGAGLLHVRCQLDRQGRRVKPKTPQALLEHRARAVPRRDPPGAPGACVRPRAREDDRSRLRVRGGDADALPEHRPARARPGA